MTSVSTTTVTDPSSVNIESAGVEDAESSQGGKPTRLESGHDLTAEEEALLAASATTLAAPAATRAATDENPGQQPHRHHMALRSQVPVGEGRLPDTQEGPRSLRIAAPDIWATWPGCPPRVTGVSLKY